MHSEDFDPIADADCCDLHEWAGYGECPRCKEIDDADAADEDECTGNPNLGENDGK